MCIHTAMPVGNCSELEAGGSQVEGDGAGSLGASKDGINEFYYTSSCRCGVSVFSFNLAPWLTGGMMEIPAGNTSNQR